MKNFYLKYKYLLKLSLLIGLVFVMGACTSNDEMEAPVSDDSVSSLLDQPRVLLTITPLVTSGTGSAYTEKVKSFRVIMLSDGLIEANQYFNLSQGDVTGVNDLAANFIYRFMKITVPGTKKFYLIANEESVKDVSFSGSISLPDGVTSGMSLSDLLSKYRAQDNLTESTFGHTTGAGAELETLLNSLSFTPDYEEMKDGSEIYLPYSAFYGSYRVVDPNSDSYNKDTDIYELNTDMHLVPDAIKFDLSITNYRKNDVTVESLEIHKINKTNYLFADLQDGEKKKNIPTDNTTAWWIDWMAACAEASKEINASGNQSLEDAQAAFNREWGWISNFEIPGNEEAATYEIVNPSSKPYITALKDIKNPTVFNLQTLYLPETKYLYELHGKEAEIEQPEIAESQNCDFVASDKQNYYLRFKFSGEDDEDYYESDYLIIKSLGSLFRSTHLKIEVEIYESQVEIYCEIQPWKPVHFQGYAEEDENY